MRFFVDTEFHERGPSYPIDLISIGAVAEDGREYYAQCLDANWGAILSEPDQFLRDHVIPGLGWWDSVRNEPKTHKMSGEKAEVWRTRREIAFDLLSFFEPSKQHRPEIWAYFADYDWVVIAQTFGRMVDLPKGMPMYCRDIKQLSDDLGVEHPGRLVERVGIEHHALYDARHASAMYGALMARKGSNSA